MPAPAQRQRTDRTVHSNCRGGGTRPPLDERPTVLALPQYADPWCLYRRRPMTTVAADLWMNPRIVPLHVCNGRWHASFENWDLPADEALEDIDIAGLRQEAYTRALSESRFSDGQQRTFYLIVVQQLKCADIARQDGRSRAAVSLQVKAMCGKWDPFREYYIGSLELRSAVIQPTWPIPADCLGIAEDGDAEPIRRRRRRARRWS